MSIGELPVLPVLLIVLGVALVGGALDAEGGGSDDVYQYTAYEVEYDDELALRDAITGRPLGNPRGTNVDERIACLPDMTRQCRFERQAMDGEVSVQAIGSRVRYVYADGSLYRIHQNGTGFEFEHEPTAPSDALADLATDSGRLTAAEREAITEGQVVTTRKFPDSNRIVEHDGDYYTLLNTGVKRYGSGGSFCASSGGGFCSDADRHRWFVRLRAAGIGLLGAVGVAAGGRELFEELRSDERE